MSSLDDPRWRQIVFSVGVQKYDWLAIFLSAMVRGEWRSFERNLLSGLACTLAYGDSEDAPSDDDIDEAANAFRYERNLLTTEETHAWLARNGLSAEAWTDYLVRQFLRARFEDELDTLLAQHEPDLDIDVEAVAAEGICSGTFDRFKTTLAGRAAVSAEVQRAPDAADESHIASVVSGHAHWLSGIDSSETVASISRLAVLESEYQAASRRALSPQALATQLARHRLDWLRVDLERLAFDDEHAAREAALCVREDGQPLSEVAAEAGAAIDDTRAVIADLPPELRDPALSGQVDDLIGPVAVGEMFEIAIVVGKANADLTDPLVRARAEAAVMAQLVSRATLAHVSWAIRE